MVVTFPLARAPAVLALPKVEELCGFCVTDTHLTTEPYRG